MVKKSKKEETYAGKTEEEWRDWGENFGKRMDRLGKKIEKGGKKFSEEAEDFADKFERHMERKSKRWKHHEFWPFGFIGPLIRSVFGIIILMVLVLALNFVNLSLGNMFIVALSSFLLRNIQWFFAFSLFFNYSHYFSRLYHKTYQIVAPLVYSLNIVIALLIATWVIDLVNIFIKMNALTLASRIIYQNLIGIFVIFVLLGYGLLAMKIMFKD